MHSGALSVNSVTQITGAALVGGGCRPNVGGGSTPQVEPRGLLRGIS